MADLITLAATDRNPIQEGEFQRALRERGIGFDIRDGRTFVEGFGSGGNTARPLAEQFFSPEAIAGRAMQSNIQNQQSDFLNRFKTEVPTAISAVEQELGLPQLRSTAQRETEFLEDIPELTEQRTTGLGVNSGQLRRITAAETQEQAPIAQRAVQQAQEGERLLNTKIGQIVQPFEIEAGMLGDNVRMQFDMFKTNVQNNLQRELAKLEQQNWNIRNEAELANAIKLAEMEQAASAGQLIDQGNQLSLINPFTGAVISTFSKGLAPIRGTGGSNTNLGSAIDRALARYSTVDLTNNNVIDLRNQ